VPHVQKSLVYCGNQLPITLYGNSDLVDTPAISHLMQGEPGCFRGIQSPANRGGSLKQCGQS
jgi:hypothetical protein